MMSIEPKTKDLLLLLLKSSSYLSINNIENELLVGKRTVYYLVNKLNDVFFRNEISPVKNQRGKGYYLDDIQKKKISALLEEESSFHFMRSQDRVYYLICWMLYPQKIIHVENIMQIFQISRNSVFSDLKKLKEEIKKHNLVLEYNSRDGYVIRGTIINNHAVLLHYLDLLLQKYHYQALHFLNASEVELYFKRLLDISSALGNEYKDESLLVISCLLSVIHHANEKFDFSLLELKDLVSTEELKLIDKMFQDFNVHERLYLAVFLLGSKAGTTLTLNDSENDIQLYELSQVLVDRFEIVSCLHLTQKSELINSLYLHFKLSLYYHNLSIQTMNPLIEDVKNSYKNLYELVRMICLEMEDLFYFPLTESEIVYITIHFGGHIQHGINKLYKSIKVLVVCPSGISTSTLLKREIENLYSNIEVVDSVSIDEISDYPDIDFIVSTIDIQSHIPWIKVHSILSKEDKTRIASMMALNYVTYQENDSGLSGLFKIIEKYVDKEKMPYLINDVHKYIQNGNSIVELNEVTDYRIFEILNEYDITVIDEKITWKDAICKASKSLVNRNIIQENYVNSMIKMIEEFGPYIVLQNEVAIAHSKASDGANFLGLSLLINKTTINFDGNNKVRYLFVLSNPDQEKHLRILRDIVDIAKNKKILEKILQSDTSAMVLYHIKKYLNEFRKTE